MCLEEAKWTYEYYFKEVDNNQDLKGDNKYSLYRIYHFSNTNNQKTFSFVLMP